MAGPLKNSDGSAEWVAGEPPQAIKVLCSVNGPIEVRLRDEKPQKATLELAYRRNVGLPMIREQLIQDRLNACLLSIVRRDLMPRSLVQVVVQVVEAWEQPAELALVAEISEAVNCLSLALADSGVPLRGLIIGSSYFITHPEGESGGHKVHSSFVPPFEKISSTHAVAYTFANGEIENLVMVESSGQFTEAELVAVLERAKTDSLQIAQKQAKVIQS